ncbi:hypothetical protein ACK2VZ_23560 (plasmid) [Salmonella enterica subsp. enterica serovar Bareilly]|uniref:hypothetical protein n=1 Tax=Salmonella enterica TaxID=28901 RepID=UPI002B20C6E4|nr:hypothetical protein [Salmonella enterica]
MSAWSPEHITLRRTENGNVIAHDSRDDQEFIVTNGAIVIHTQRLKSDPGGNLLS